jgi:hypothetical protein
LCPTVLAWRGQTPEVGRITVPALALCEAALPNEIRRAVREEVQRYFGDTGGPIEWEAEYRIARGQR